MNHAILSAVLARANACPPISFREQFYGIKQHILERWGVRCGTDYQRIVKRCWAYDCDEDCGRCGGTGVYETMTVELERWLFHHRVFHRPVKRLYGKEAQHAPITIEGKIEHRRIEGSRVCSAALFLLFAPHHLNIETRGGASSVDFARRAIRIAASIGPVAKGDVMTPVEVGTEIPF